MLHNLSNTSPSYNMANCIFPAGFCQADRLIHATSKFMKR